MSTADGWQTTRSHKSALKAVGVTEFREEHVSGMKGVLQRPRLASLLGQLQVGDQLYFRGNADQCTLCLSC